MRSIGIRDPCPLLARAARDDLAGAERVRAGVTAHSAFADPRGADLALAAAPLVALDELGAVVSEVALIDRALVVDFAAAAAGTGSCRRDTLLERADVVAGVLADLGYIELSAQIQNEAALSEDGRRAPQLAPLGADR